MLDVLRLRPLGDNQFFVLCEEPGSVYCRVDAAVGCKCEPWDVLFHCIKELLSYSGSCVRSLITPVESAISVSFIYQKSRVQIGPSPFFAERRVSRHPERVPS